MFNETVKNVDKAHKVLEEQGLKLCQQNLRGPKDIHKTEFFLYNVENIMLFNGVGIDRSLNKPVTNFSKEEKTEIKVKDKILNYTMYANKKQVNFSLE